MNAKKKKKESFLSLSRVSKLVVRNPLYGKAQKKCALCLISHSHAVPYPNFSFYVPKEKE